MQYFSSSSLGMSIGGIALTSSADEGNILISGFSLETSEIFLRRSITEKEPVYSAWDIKIAEIKKITTTVIIIAFFIFCISYFLKYSCLYL
ncbi:MAG: hypothetical protein KJ955_03610 [Nanoarchaeota archaeon]|nr:hypothetical protein [Nanoarchaeota archaeon]